jgi:hypothetical protein
MKSRTHILFHSVAVVSLAFISLGSAAFAQQEQPQEMTATTDEQAATLPPEELDSLVAPIALYPDQLLAQTLAASTYPLEIIQLQQWMDKNKNLTGKALAEAASKEPWDASIQGLVAFPDVVQRMAANVEWTTDMGNAFLAQQQDVMDAIQRMRAKAEGTGNLKTSSQQKVETEETGGKKVIKIEDAEAETVYVPSYDPEVVYGSPPAEYPYYPYTYPGYVPGAALAWGTGIVVGAAIWGNWAGHWGNCDWNHGDVNINKNFNYNKNVNRGQGGNKWQHNPQHRGNAPYGDKRTSDKFGGNKRQQPNRSGGDRNGPGGRNDAAGRNGPGGRNDVGGRKDAGGRNNVTGRNDAGGRKDGGARKDAGGAGPRSSSGATAKNKVGDRSASSRPSTGSKGGGFSSSSGKTARASSSRGGSSMGGGGMSSGGGRSGGGSRGGGGGGRGGGRRR